MSIEEKISKSTSGKQLKDFLGGKVKVIAYPELRKYDTIEELLSPYGAVIILYLQKQGYGHWTCVFYQDANTIECYDPYGLFVDDELDWKMDKYFREENGLEYPMLSLLLYEAFDRYIMTFNEFRFQKLQKDVSTCGRHVVCRILFRDLSLLDYYQLMYSTDYTPDELVTLITSEI